MRAPRAVARSYSSRISTPAPSPTMKPSRSLSNGRLARSGSSLRVDRARSAPKPPMPIGVIAASEPPAIITSGGPRLMISKAPADVGGATLDDLEGIADRVRRRRARRAGRRVRPLGAEADRHLAGGEVDDGRG